MKFLWQLIILFWLITGCSQQDNSVFHDMKGNPVQLSQLKGKWVIVNYWAPWCHNCANEIPELNNFYKNNKDPHVALYGVDVDDASPDDLKEIIQQMDIQFPVLQEDPLHAWNFNEVEAVPMTFIIGPKGDVVKKVIGAHSEESFKDILHELQKDFEQTTVKS